MNIEKTGAQFEAYRLAQLYSQVLGYLLQLHEPGKHIDKGTTAEVLGAHCVLYEPFYNLIQTRTRKFNYRYMVAEMLWNISGTDDIRVLERVFPGVTRFVADQPEGYRSRATWAYGPYMRHQLDQVFIELHKNPSSRRAIITLPHPRFDRPGTPPCLDSIQWFIRDHRLVQITRMRSNDVWRGFPLDVYQFSMWQLMMASALGVPPGPYHHFANSLHLYEQDEPEARRLLEAGDMKSVRSSLPDHTAIRHAANGGLWDELLMNQAEAPFETGWSPWLLAYIGEPALLPEFEQLREGGFGTGW